MKHLKLFEAFFGSEGSGVLPICSSTGRICIGLRAEWVDQPHTWGNFGGAIGTDHYGGDEEKLSPEANARKEMVEETGYTGELELISSYEFSSGSFKYYNFIGMVDSEFTLDKSDMEHVEVDEIKWVTLDELINHSDIHFGIQSILDNNMAQLIDIIEKLK